jgi:hypothetical protein
VFKNNLFVPLQTLEHPEGQKAEIKYVLGFFLCPSQLSCSRMDLAESNPGSTIFQGLFWLCHVFISICN